MTFTIKDVVEIGNTARGAYQLKELAGGETNYSEFVKRFNAVVQAICDDRGIMGSEIQDLPPETELGEKAQKAFEDLCFLFPRD